MSPLRQFILSLFLIALLIFLGTLGYITIEGWTLPESLYMTFITISTVGYGEVRPLSPEGRNFTIIFLTIGVIVIGFTLTRLVAFLFEGQIVKTVKERRMKRFLSMMKDHIVICGFGDIGKEVTDEFLKKKVKFVVVDKSLDETDTKRYSDVLFISGDAAEEETLREARIEKAKGLISCLPEDQQNVFVVLTARQLNGDLYIVTKASDDRNVIKLKKAGANRVISPKQIAGHRMAAVTIQPSIVNFLEILSSGGEDSVRIESIRVGKGSPMAGKSLKESNIGSHTGAVIIGILGPDGQARMNQSSLATLSSRILNEGDELIALGNEEQLSRLAALAAGRD
ncbi:MAG: potassium channel protein [Spirochaetales bacterium]|nr:potassium channel protein [Spirochaetales bacterium]